MKALQYLIFGFLLLTSCGDNDADKPFDEPDAITALKPDLGQSGLEIKLWQELEGENTYSLYVTNHERIECITDLSGEITVEARNMTMTFTADQQADCDPEMEFLTTQIDLKEYSSEYAVKIVTGEVENLGKIRFDTDVMQLKLETSDALFIDDIVINKLPENIAWGYASMTATASMDIAELFNGPILSATPGADLVQLKDGNYGYLTYDEADHKILEINGTESWGQAMLLSIKEEGEWLRLGDILERIETTFPTISYFFQNAEGAVYER